MTAKWPVITATVKHYLTATHSLPGLGNAEKHGHTWEIEAGWTHEINPTAGHAIGYLQADKELLDLIKQLQGEYLNDKFTQAPTAETIACWIGAHLPAYWDSVTVSSYGNFKVVLKLGANRQELLKDYR